MEQNKTNIIEKILTNDKKISVKDIILFLIIKYFFKNPMKK